ncbi:histidine phosphatase family protein [Patescibacteria group bacterium]|nr:histidine phosphatase family protein [Patescibacteria group bacterium]
MKEVHIRRHAPKDATGVLTEEGKKLATAFKQGLQEFNLVISSNKPRAVETAQLLTGIYPMLDTRASGIPFTKEQEKEFHERGNHHPFGIAGVIFDSTEFRPLIIKKGENLVALITETFDKLPEEGRALIISHDGVMVAADMILRHAPLTKAEKTYEPLQGFVVYEDQTVKDLL